MLSAHANRINLWSNQTAIKNVYRAALSVASCSLIMTQYPRNLLLWITTRQSSGCIPRVIKQAIFCSGTTPLDRKSRADLFALHSRYQRHHILFKSLPMTIGCFTYSTHLAIFYFTLFFLKKSDFTFGSV